MPNMARREARIRDNPARGDLALADDVRRKNFSSVLSCLDKKTKKTVTVAAKSGQFTANETGKASSSEETEGIWQKRKL